jgi:hypothetical protein
MNAKTISDTVKVYFINPIEAISVVSDVLIKLNFEVYSLGVSDIYRLIPLLRQHPRNVIYMCLLSENDTAQWLLYIDTLQKLTETQIQFGVFVSSLINKPARTAFLNRGVATIDIVHLQTNTLETLKKILLYFEAREKRKFVRASALGICQAFFKMKNLTSPIKGNIVEISIQAFSCQIEASDKLFFTHNDVIGDVTIVLRGKRIRISARFMGFDQSMQNVAVFVIYIPQAAGTELDYHHDLPQKVRNTIYEYIQTFLKEDIKQQLAEMPEEKPELEFPELL